MTPPFEHLVVVLPGIGGSILAPPDKLDEPVWGGRLRDVGDILTRPGDLDISVPLVPVGLIRTRKPLPFWTAILGYDGLLTRLGQQLGVEVDPGTPDQRNLDAGLVGIGYDFRHSVERAADLVDDVVRERLSHLWPTEKQEKRVVVIAHSMGGLVARSWLADPRNAPLCERLVTLGTPHGGAPKALDVLANGIRASLWRLTKPVAVLRGWPGAAELLPRYPAVIDTAKGDRYASLRPHELPLTWLQRPAADSYAVHRRIDEGWEAAGYHPMQVARIGHGHGTLRRCEWDGANVVVSRTSPSIEGMEGYDDDRGDGTVPVYCGMPAELADKDMPWDLRVEERHGPIIDLRGMADLSRGDRASFPIRGEERVVALGLDLEPVGAPSTATELRARFVGLATADLGRPLYARITPIEHDALREDRQQWHPLEWDSEHGEYAGDLPAQEPGLYEVYVKAESVPGAGDSEARETLQVIDEATMSDAVDDPGIRPAGR